MNKIAHFIFFIIISNLYNLDAMSLKIPQFYPLITNDQQLYQIPPNIKSYYTSIFNQDGSEEEEQYLPDTYENISYKDLILIMPLLHYIESINPRKKTPALFEHLNKNLNDSNYSIEIVCNFLNIANNIDWLPLKKASAKLLAKELNFHKNSITRIITKTNIRQLLTNYYYTLTKYKFAGLCDSDNEEKISTKITLSFLKKNTSDSIKIDKIKYFTHLNLINKCLIDLQGILDIENFKELKKLSLDENLLTEKNLNPIKHFSNLIILSITQNLLKEIPSEILELNSLQQLYLVNNEIIEIPENIDRLRNLKRLNISKNKIKKIPDTLINIKSLEYLLLSHNNISKIPYNLKILEKLKFLNLSNNALIKSPETLPPAIECLNLSRNKLNDFPNQISYCINLKQLLLRDCELKAPKNKTVYNIHLDTLNFKKNKLSEGDKEKIINKFKTIKKINK